MLFMDLTRIKTVFEDLEHGMVYHNTRRHTIEEIK